MQVIEGRHSGRAYDPIKPVTNEQIHTLVEAARWTPSCYGEEPWRFIICQKSAASENISAYDGVLNALAEGNQKWASKAPVLIVAVANTTFTCNYQGPNRWGAYDTGAAAQTMMLVAHAQGLMLHPMGGFDANAIATFFKIPPTFQIMAVMALGYELSSLPATPPRSRQPLETRFFFNAWQEA